LHAGNESVSLEGLHVVSINLLQSLITLAVLVFAKFNNVGGELAEGTDHFYFYREGVPLPLDRLRPLVQ
jgi:hypothetical protein